MIRQCGIAALRAGRKSIISYRPLLAGLSHLQFETTISRTMSTSKITRLGTDANPNMSSAVVYNGTLTTMGVIDLNGETVEEQTQNILDTIDGLLAEGGTDKSKCISANIWLKDIKDFAAMNSVWVKWIDADHKPVRACVESNLAFPSLLVEIQVVAAV